MSSASAQVHSLPAHVAQFHKDAPPSLAISARDLPERLSLAGAGQTVKGMLCNAALQAVSTLLDRRAAETCRAASGERRFIDFFSYPVSSFLRLSFTAAELSRSKLGGYDAAFRTLGKQAVDDFLSTAVGKTLRSLGSTRTTRGCSARCCSRWGWARRSGSPGAGSGCWTPTTRSSGTDGRRRTKVRGL